MLSNVWILSINCANMAAAVLFNTECVRNDAAILKWNMVLSNGGLHREVYIIVNIILHQNYVKYRTTFMHD